MDEAQPNPTRGCRFGGCGAPFDRRLKSVDGAMQMKMMNRKRDLGASTVLFLMVVWHPS